MFEVKCNSNVPEQDHHKFTYKEGKKNPIPDDGVCFLYIDKAGLLHASEWEDEASEYGNGKYAVTDECKADDGFPIINGVKVEVWGVGEGFIYRTKNSKLNDVRYLVTDEPYKINKSVTIDRTKLSKKEHAAYEKAHEFYSAF